MPSGAIELDAPLLMLLYSRCAEQGGFVSALIYFSLHKGGGGALAQECVFLYPNCTVTVYDLPKVVQVAKERLVPPEERRIAFHEGRCRHLCRKVLAVVGRCRPAGLWWAWVAYGWLLTGETGDQKCPCSTLP